LDKKALKEYLDRKFLEFNSKDFIKNDPISVPHQYSKKQDIEITAFWTAILSWGLRKTIINKANELFDYMDRAPYDFIINHKDSDLKKIQHFKHRTFNSTDTLYFIHFLKDYYSNNESLEIAFSNHLTKDDEHVGAALIGFHHLFFSLPFAPMRTRKHIASPERNSTCKRLNMFLRWMVRNDDLGVDFGLWKNIDPSQLLCPFDVHVERVARKLGLINRKQRDWKTLLELHASLKEFDPCDPAKYDYALFGIGILDK